MYCLRWWIPLFLLPFPKTSPYFLILFLFSFALHSQPCMYCALILTGLFSTSPNWYGPDQIIVPVKTTDSTVSIMASNSSRPRASYGWLGLGFSGGNGFFSPLSRPISSSSSVTHGVAIPADDEPSFYHLSIPWSESRVQIPKRFYLGLGKHQGLGMWIDLGNGTGDHSPSGATNTESSDGVSDASAAVKHVEL